MATTGQTNGGARGTEEGVGGPIETPTTPRRGWRKWWAIVGIAGGFLDLIVPGIFALRSYIKWERGEKERPTFAWVWAVVFVTFTGIGLAVELLDSHRAVTEVHDDFSRPDTGWAAGNNSRATLGYVGGSYRILIKVQSDTEDSLFFVSKSSDAVTVQADVRKQVAEGTEVAAGVACIVRTGTGYGFAIDPDTGQYFVLRVLEDQVTILQEDASDAVRVGEGTNRVRGDCAGDGGSGPVTLTMYVNGQLVDRTRQASGIGSFKGIGLIASTADQGGAEARFDNALMEPLP